MSADIKIEGIEDLVAQLKAMQPKPNEVKAMLELAAEPIRAEAANTIPRTASPRQATAKNSWRTGQHLADNVVVDTASSFVGVTFNGGIQNGPFFYGKFGEYGREHETPRYWLQTAADAKASDAENILESELKKKVGG